MTQHTLAPQLPNTSQWEDDLRHWAQTLSPLMLGLRLTALLREVMPTTAHSLLDTIAQQYRHPEESRRWQLFEQAKTLGFSTPIGALVLSQFWSHGSMSPDSLPPVYPEPELSPHMMHCALVMLAAQLAESPADGVNQLIARSAMLEVV